MQKFQKKLQGWKVWKCEIKLENVTKIRKMKDDNRNKRGNIGGGGGGGGWGGCKNPKGYTKE